MCGTCLATGLTATVIVVVDGKTIEIESLENGRQVVVLSGIDAPEPDQKFFAEAKSFLEKRLLSKEVTVFFKGKTRTGQPLVTVMLGKNDIRVQLVKEGLAWMDEKKTDSTLEPFLIQAQKKERGIWTEPNPTPPWTFRRQRSMEDAKSS